MSDTTNISDLPRPQGNNITLEMREKQGGVIAMSGPQQGGPRSNAMPGPHQAGPRSNAMPGPHQGGPRSIPHHGGSPQQPPRHMQMPPDDVGKIVSGIKSASAANLTRLPSRDIPMMTHPHVQDKQSRPNYVPQPPPQQHADYIKQHDSIQQMIQKAHKQDVKEDRMEQIYEELQTPVFVMVLFLLFQLPFFQKMLYRQLPSLFSRDGHTHLGGYLFKTLLFGASFYLIQRGIKYLSLQ